MVPMTSATTMIAKSIGFTYGYLREAIVEVRCSAKYTHRWKCVRQRRSLPERSGALQGSHVNILAESLSCQAANVLCMVL